MALGLTLLSLIFTILIYVRVNKFFRQGSGQSFEGTVANILKNIEALQNFQKELTDYVNILEKRVSRTVAAAHLKRYNPFKGVGEGGQQSHSTALISEQGDGVMLSTLATRDRVSVFAKPIKKFESEMEFTPEEKETLNEARKILSL